MEDSGDPAVTLETEELLSVLKDAYHRGLPPQAALEIARRTWHDLRQRAELDAVGEARADDGPENRTEGT